MPRVEVNGVSIAYEVAGDGPPIVWIPGGRLPRNPFTYVFAGRFSKDYKVLTWDRRNRGESGFLISDSPNEWHTDTDDLHSLLGQIDMSPAYIGGGSGGCMLSLLMAHRYPEDVKGLILANPPSDSRDKIRPLLAAWYWVLADAAERGGMQEVIKISSNPPEMPFQMLTNWISKCADQSPDVGEKILSMDPKWFASILRRWGDWWDNGRMHLANLADEEVTRIDVPAIIAPGRNDLHPEHAARQLFGRLPNASWVEYSARLSEDEIRHITEEEHGWSTYFAYLSPFLEDFLHRVESGTFEPDKK
jgi:pimeloyl-ACP methyl ester carboxylesterase